MGRTKVQFYGFTWLRNSQAKFIVPLRSISFAVSSPGSSAPMSPQNEHKQTRVSSHSIPVSLLLGGKPVPGTRKEAATQAFTEPFIFSPTWMQRVTPKGLSFFWLLLDLPLVPAFPLSHLQLDRCVRNSRVEAGDCATVGLHSCFSQKERQEGESRFQIYPAITESTLIHWILN